MQCIKSSVEVEDVIKKSRFIGIIMPCYSANEAHQYLQQQAQQHLNASHIAFAYRIKLNTGIITRFYDAGEPSGTAGKPIFQHLIGNKDLINLLCIVIRYYGGIKLGAGGLTRAYGNTAKKVIEASHITPFIEYEKIKIELNYNQMQNVEYHLKKLEGEIVEQQFTEKISLLINIPQKNIDALAKLFEFL
jgi:uncharacterized YigZ family protein